MSAAIPILDDQAAAPQAPVDAQTMQEQLDRLFRANARDDQADWATGMLRRYVEDYRLQRQVDA